MFASPGAIAFQIGPFAVRWYGLLIAAGVMLGTTLAHREALRRGQDPDKLLNLIVVVVLSALLGARLYYVLFNWDYYGTQLSKVFAIWEGGLAIHGGLIAGALADTRDRRTIMLASQFFTLTASVVLAAITLAGAITPSLLLLLIVAVLAGSMALVAIGFVKVKMLPFDNKSEFQVILNMPEGSALERTAQAAREIAAAIRTEPEVTDYQIYAGVASPFNDRLPKVNLGLKPVPSALRTPGVITFQPTKTIETGDASSPGADPDHPIPCLSN